VYQVLMDEVDIKQSILETESGIYVIPGAIDLLMIEHRLGHSKSQVQRLKTHLQPVANYFDVILIDTPAGYTSLIVNAIVAASGNIIIPLDSGVFSYESLEIFYLFLNELAKNYQVSIRFMAVLHREEVPSSLPKRPTLNLLKKMGRFWQTTSKSESSFLYTPESALQLFWEQTGMQPVKIYHLPHSAEIVQSQINGVPISHYASNSDIARIYQQITNELYL
jgi:cellulose biosynthesis protein BcsQ